jgi:hypothetical protein
MVTQPTAKFKRITSSPYDDSPKPRSGFTHDISVADPNQVFKQFDIIWKRLFIILKISVYWMECNVCKV